MGKGRGKGRGRGQGGKQRGQQPTPPGQIQQQQDPAPGQRQIAQAVQQRPSVTPNPQQQQQIPSQITSSMQHVSLTQQGEKTQKPQQENQIKEGETSKGASKEVIPLPERPNFGTSGKKVQLCTNFFPLNILRNTIICQYDVTISEGKTTDRFPKEKSRKIIEKLIDDNQTNYFKVRPVFNGKKIMYTKEELDFQGSKTFEVQFVDDYEKKPRKYQVTLKKVTEIDFNVIMNEMQRRGSGLQEMISGLDHVLRHASTLQNFPLGSRIFSSANPINLGGCREMWSGFIMSARPTNRWKIMLNVDVSATAFLREIYVTEYLYHTINYDCRNLNRPLRDSERKQFSKKIRGLKIKAIHMKQRRKYRVNDVTKESAERLRFIQTDSTETTVARYFETQKDWKLKFPHLPCLHVGSLNKKIYLPLEVCVLVKGQQSKDLTQDETRKMIRETAKKPHERKNIINNIMRELNFPGNQYAKDFGIQVDNRMMKVDGRVIPPPEILYRGMTPLTPSGGAWNMKDLKVFEGATIKAWGLIIADHRTRDDAAGNFKRKLVNMANIMGINMRDCVFQRKCSADRDSPEQIVSEGLKRNNELDLLVVILPGETPFYANLKRLCETEIGHQSIGDAAVRELLKKRGLRTQCIQGKNASKCNPMCLAQLLLKVNAKMGGVNNSINQDGPNCHITRPRRIFNEPVLFMGADVTHPTGRFDDKKPSIAAIVGSVDPYPSRYAVCVRVQEPRMEMIEDMKGVTMELLKQFYVETKCKPHKIIMYRDGVSEGQFQQVLNQELRKIQEACTALEPGYQPSITFIVVQKRHHARFFNLNRDDSDRSGNCYPGTTIDSEVCHPVEYDYYQYSHSGIQGTSSPTHYHVLHDDNDFKPDELQALSFMLCHLYVRCTRSVSIPAPAYYAHHVAFRATYHLKGNEDDSSSDSGDLAQEVLQRLGNIAKPHQRLMNQMYFV